MIKINRTTCPASLNKEDSEFVKNDYKNEDVVNDLMIMQYYKCCYCERDLKELDDSEIEGEHFIPRSLLKDASGTHQWYLINKWENLLRVCRSCNLDKLDTPPFNKDSGEREIIDPACPDIDPEDYIDFIIDDTVVSFKEKDGKALGRLTIEKLKFSNRLDLLKKFRKLNKIIECKFIDIINALTSENEHQVDSLTKELSQRMNADKEFAAFSRNAMRKIQDYHNSVGIPKLEKHDKKSYGRISIVFPKRNEILN